jgi:hypothetical protein
MSNPLDFQTLRQVHIDWLIQNGVTPDSIIKPTVMELARGSKAADGVFEHGFGLEWFAIPVDDDAVYWRPKTGEIATEFGTVFALGQEHVLNPGVTALGRWLHIHSSPLDWLREGRQGLFILRWEWAFEQLRDVARVAVPEGLVGRYERAMKPPHLPEIGVIPSEAGRMAA